MSGNLGNTKTSKWTVSQLAGMQGITDDEYIAKQKEENRKKYLAQFAGIDGFGSADTRYMSYPLSRSAQENTGDTLRISCLEYVAPTNGGGNFGVEVKNKYITQNFADGKKPGRKGISKRVGIPKGATLTQLAKLAKAKGEKGRMARWQLNMRRGKKKKKSS